MDILLHSFVEQFEKSQRHLNYSFLKVQKMPFISEQSSEEQLESWESFASRFSRSSDLLLSKVFRRLILTKDPAFRGSVIDLLNQAEKFSWIDSAKEWQRIRELRNIAAHEYTVNEFQTLYRELLRLSPLILKVKIENA
ncbi:MAG: hypothetical protein KA436_00935 [Oligoflexales bacterium]|nr:hypothetical protein [Oligoflexales bacterium]